MPRAVKRYGLPAVLAVGILVVGGSTAGARLFDGGDSANEPDRVRVEPLVARAPAVDAGATLTVDSGLRSTFETVVTIRVASERPLEQLGQPTLEYEGRLLEGRLIGSQDDGRLATFSFPPTPFGSSVALRFGPFIAAGDQQNAAVAVDFARMLARAGLTGAHGQAAAIEPDDIISATGELPLAGVRFDHSVVINGVPEKALVLRFDRAIDRSSGSAFSASVDGVELRGGPVYISYPRDAAGSLSQTGQTEVAFLYHSFDDLSGLLSVTFVGEPSEVIRGDWRLELTPVATGP